MENKQAVAVAVGVGAIGTALAYLGYSAYHKNSDIAHIEGESQKKSSWLDNLWNKSNEKESLYNEVDEEGKTDDVQLREALKEEKNIKIAAQKKNSAWGKFWHNSHKDMIDEKNEDN